MRPSHRSCASFVAAALLTAGNAAGAPPSARLFDPPLRTEWKPEGCRYVPADDPVLGARNRWRMLHADSAASDEVSIALAPVFEAGWHAEPATFNVTVPVFDAAGNLYFVPFLPYENVALLSLDPSDGSRRWSIAGTGAPTGAVAPMTLDDPDNPGDEHIYVTLYDRAFAVTPSGSVVWNVPTGLTLTGTLSKDATTGNSYLPQRDAIAGLTGSGHVYLLDRATGAQLLDEPFSLPGEPSPAGAGVALPPDLVDTVEADLTELINFPPGSTFEGFLGAILGNSIEVSNSFAIDANTGRMWIVATAPDDADGTVDGVSELGSLYGLDVIDGGGGGPEIEIACRRDFVGGSASTPGITADGTRIYVADNIGTVFAIDSECNDLWSLDLGSQITGSIAVAADNREIYASTQSDIVKIYDNGFAGEIAWTADMDVYRTSAANQSSFNTLLASIAANGIGFMAGGGIAPGDLANIGLPMKVGYGVLDRETGEVRYFADGLDESVAEMDSGPDGAYYNSNSPIRHAFTRALFPSLTEPVEGGIRKFEPRRLDRLASDAVCAAADRAGNASAHPECSAGAPADAVQIGELMDQALAAGELAVGDGDLSAAGLARLTDLVDAAHGQSFAVQLPALSRACLVSAPCAPQPRGDCLAAGASKLLLKRSKDPTAVAGKIAWKWRDGAAFDGGDIGDPTDVSDFGVCVYVGADADTRLAWAASVPASEQWKTRPQSASWKGRERGLAKLKLVGGEAGETSLQAKAAGAAFRRGTFVIDADIVVQLESFETGTCWSSRFGEDDFRRSDAFVLKAQN